MWRWTVDAIGVGALRRVAKVDQGVGKRKAAYGLVRSGGGHNRSPIATGRQAINPVDFDWKGAKGDTARGRDTVVRSTNLNAGGHQVAIVAHSPNQTWPGWRAGKVVAQISLPTGNHIQNISVHVGDDQPICTLQSIGAGGKRKKPPGQVHTHLSDTVDCTLGLNQSPIAIQKVGVSRSG